MAIPPLPEGVRPGLRSKVANELHSVAIHLLRRARLVDRESGLTPERLSLLSVLCYVGPLTIGELADAELVSSPAISRTVGALERDGLVRRERRTSDRRVVAVHATEAGRSLMEKARRRRIETVATHLGQLTSQELRSLDDAAVLLDEHLSRGIGE